MKSIALQASLEELRAKWKARRMLWHRAMKRCVEAGNMRYVGEGDHRTPYHIERRRQVYGSESCSVCELRQYLWSDLLVLT